MLENRHIIFDFTKDVRGCFREGEHIDLELDFLNPCYIVGKNGCGKSTLLQRMRGEKDSLEKITRGRRCLTPSCIETWKRDNDISVTGLDQFDNIFYLDSIADDPLSFENSADGASFVAGGGMAVMQASKGQKSTHMLSVFMRDIESVIGESGGQDGESVNLVVLDEVDEGFDLYMQMRFHRIAHGLAMKSNAYLICVTHNPLCYINGAEKVYSLEERTMIPTREYIRKVSGGYDIEISGKEQE